MLTRAYAKLNLCLSVGAPVASGEKAGFHPIASWMHCIDLFDEVRTAPLPAGTPSSLHVAWAPDALRPTPIDWPIEKDLAFRAHRALEAELGKELPAAVEVVKRIPVGGGLGGGSSDAAATLMGLVRAFSLDVEPSTLLAIAASLGSDVAFFLDPDSGAAEPPRPALVGGFGDTIERVPRLRGEVLLVIPPFGCPTGPVYKAFDALLEERQAHERAERAIRGLAGREKQTGPRDQLVRSRCEKMTGRLDGDKLFNDLAIPAYRVEPRLGALATALANATREKVHVTGSGSGLFVPVVSGKTERLLERASRLVETLSQDQPHAAAVLLRAALV